MSSSWPVVFALVALALGAVWYDAQHSASPATSAARSPLVAAVAHK